MSHSHPFRRRRTTSDDQWMPSWFLASAIELWCTSGTQTRTTGQSAKFLESGGTLWDLRRNKSTTIWPFRYKNAIATENCDILEKKMPLPINVGFEYISSCVYRLKRPTLRPTLTGSGATKTGRSPVLKDVGCQGAKTLERGACLSQQVCVLSAVTKCKMFLFLTGLFLSPDRTALCGAEGGWSRSGGHVWEEYRRK